MRKKINGYMTIEASFIIPFVFMLFVLIIYFSFYLYNQCVVYQDCYIAALRGSQIRNSSTSYVESITEKHIDSLLDNQIFEYCKDYEVNCTVFSVKTEASSDIGMNFNNLMPYNEKNLHTEKSASATRIDPVELIRLKRVVGD